MTPAIKEFGFRAVSAFACIGLAICATATAQDKKLTAEEVVSRHLDAIGSKEARAAVTRRVVSGPVVQCDRAAFFVRT